MIHAPAVCTAVQDMQWSFRKRRIILTQWQAAEIYEMKPESGPAVSHRRSASQSRLVAERYGVSSKTVRDIWNKKTWIFATIHLHAASHSHDASQCPEQIGPYKVGHTEKIRYLTRPLLIATPDSATTRQLREEKKRTTAWILRLKAKKEKRCLGPLSTLLPNNL